MTIKGDNFFSGSCTEYVQNSKNFQKPLLKWLQFDGCYTEQG